MGTHQLVTLIVNKKLLLCGWQEKKMEMGRGLMEMGRSLRGRSLRSSCWEWLAVCFPHARTHIHAHAHMHTHTLTDTHAYTHAHTNTHTHTHTNIHPRSNTHVHDRHA